MVDKRARGLSLFLLLSYPKWLPNQEKRNVNLTKKKFEKCGNWAVNCFKQTLKFHGLKLGATVINITEEYIVILNNNKTILGTIIRNNFIKRCVNR